MELLLASVRLSALSVATELSASMLPFTLICNAYCSEFQLNPDLSQLLSRMDQPDLAWPSLFEVVYFGFPSFPLMYTA